MSRLGLHRFAWITESDAEVVRHWQEGGTLSQISLTVNFTLALDFPIWLAKVNSKVD